MQKYLKTKLLLKHATEAEWRDFGYIPEKGEPIIFDSDNNYNYDRLKIGDGKLLSEQLPFIGQNIVNQRNTHEQFSSMNLVYSYGEMLIVEDSGSLKLKFGDGVSTYLQLPFYGDMYADKPTYNYQEIEGLDTQLLALASAIGACQTQVDQNSTNIGNLQTATEAHAAEFVQINTNLNALSEQVASIPIIPSGLIAIWSGSLTNIPNGWALCDGQSGRPDLRDKFVLGASDNFPPNSVGGEAEHILTIEELPSHTHNYRHHQLNREDTDNPTGEDAYGVSNKTLDMHSSPTEAAGGGQAHNNMPPYYALCYIIKL